MEELFEALSILDKAFMKGESVKTGFISLLKSYNVPMANETAVLIRKKGWITTDKSKEDGKRTFIAWNGPRVTKLLCLEIYEEVKLKRRNDKAVAKSINIKDEIKAIELEVEALEKEIHQKNIILNYLKSKLS